MRWQLMGDKVSDSTVPPHNSEPWQFLTYLPRKLSVVNVGSNDQTVYSNA